MINRRDDKVKSKNELQHNHLVRKLKRYLRRKEGYAHLLPTLDKLDAVVALEVPGWVPKAYYGLIERAKNG